MLRLLAETIALTGLQCKLSSSLDQIIKNLYSNKIPWETHKYDRFEQHKNRQSHAKHIEKYPNVINYY